MSTGWNTNKQYRADRKRAGWIFLVRNHLFIQQYRPDIITYWSPAGAGRAVVVLLRPELELLTFSRHIV